jgi:hypothetical protein
MFQQKRVNRYAVQGKSDPSACHKGVKGNRDNNSSHFYCWHQMEVSGRFYVLALYSWGEFRLDGFTLGLLILENAELICASQ